MQHTCTEGKRKEAVKDCAFTAGSAGKAPTSPHTYHQAEIMEFAAQDQGVVTGDSGSAEGA